MDCPICLAEISLMVTLACTHQFCLTCMMKWGAMNDTCPLCRREHGLPPMTCSSKTQRNKMRRLRNRITRLEDIVVYLGETLDIYELMELDEPIIPRAL